MQSILITGANKGVGSAMVEAILREQEEYRVFLGSRDLARGEAERSRLLEVTGAKADRLEVMLLDVSDEDSVRQAAARLQATGEKLYGLVNNAGIASGSLSQVFAVNVYGMQRVSELFIPLMSDRGRVVNVTSASGPSYVSQSAAIWQSFFQNEQADWAGLNAFMRECQSLTAEQMEQKGLPANAYYGLSKACANLLNMMSARDNPHLTINACTLGYIETDMTRQMTGASGARATELGMKQPADGARVVMHLLFEAEGTGHYFGSDALRSPLDRYRSPGSPAYTGR